MKPTDTAKAYIKSYTTWKSMIKRVTDPRDSRWKDYGGRGIKLHAQWKDYDNFFLDMGLPPTPRHSLDRINNDGNYEPGNCRWATNKEQCNNKRNTIWLEFRGERLPLAIWANRIGVDDSLIYQRLFRCRWSVEKTLTTPSRQR